MTPIERYTACVAQGRAFLVDGEITGALLAPDLSAAVLHRFLVEFSARGVRMTEPVEGWIRRAGDRCAEIGLPEIGAKLRGHSKQEAGHHEMLIADTRKLVSTWNQRRAPVLDADLLLRQEPFTSTRDYVQLHEETIAGDAPFGQVAIELEIERMSVTFGPPLLAQCRRLLEPEVLEGLSFIRDHVELDVGHTALNGRLLQTLLELRPDAAEELGGLGIRALRAYVGFFGQCLEVARAAA